MRWLQVTGLSCAFSWLVYLWEQCYSAQCFSNGGVPDQSNTIYSIAPSSAMVFATGSIYWTSALDTYRLPMDKLRIGQETVIPGMQKLMANVMAALVVPHTS
jgi:hypothetical protein